MPIFTVVGNCCNAYYASKLFPQYNCAGSLSSEQKKDIQKRVAGLFINNLGTVSRNSLDSLVISAYLGLTIVAIYNNYYYVISTLISIMGIVTSSITSSVGNSMCCESVEKNYADFKRFQYMYAMMVCWCTTCLIVLYQPFMKLWVGADLMFPFYMVIIFAFYFFMRSISGVSSLYYNAAGLWWEGKLRYIVETILNLVFNIVLGYYWGVLGIILASIFTMFAFTYWYGGGLIFRFYFKNGKLSVYFMDNFIYMFQAAVVTVAVYGICSFIPNGETTFTEIILLFVRAGVCAVLTAILMLFIWFRTERFHDAFGWTRKVFHIPSKFKLKKIRFGV
jgi:O-antigen/teichoic acid export membrane protein